MFLPLLVLLTPPSPTLLLLSRELKQTTTTTATTGERHTDICLMRKTMAQCTFLLKLITFLGVLLKTKT